MDALTITLKFILYVLLYSFTYFSRQNSENTDRDINHSIHAVHVASKAIIIFNLQIRANVLSHASVKLNVK